jgi:hypothetical protein
MSDDPDVRPGGGPQMLDLSRFASLEDAVAQADTSNRYRDILVDVIPEEPGFAISPDLIFLQSTISRVQGLHEATVREIRHSNPHAVFPLLRVLLESLALVIYVTDTPAYIATVMQRERDITAGSPKSKTMQSLIAHAVKVAPGLKNVYAELSEITHFGASAMWTSHVIESEATKETSWTNIPRWRDPEQSLIACATTIELADGVEQILREFATRYCAPGGTPSTPVAVNTTIFRPTD